MSKLAIFLCAVLFASAANASYWSDAVESIREKVEGIIDAAIFEVKERFEAIELRAQAVAEKLVDTASEISEKIHDNIKKELERVLDEVNKIIGRAEGVDTTECNDIAAHVNYTANAAISKMGECVTKKLLTATEYIESIINITTRVGMNLSEIREEATHCSINVESMKSIISATICANMAAAKAAWVSTKAAPQVLFKVGQLNLLLTTLQPSLTYCTTTNGLITFYKEASTIVDSTEKCIQQKIDEAGSLPTTEIIQSTEEVQA